MLAAGVERELSRLKACQPGHRERQSLTRDPTPRVEDYSTSSPPRFIERHTAEARPWTTTTPGTFRTAVPSAASGAG